MLGARGLWDCSLGKVWHPACLLQMLVILVYLF